VAAVDVSRGGVFRRAHLRIVAAAASRQVEDNPTPTWRHAPIPDSSDDSDGTGHSAAEATPHTRNPRVGQTLMDTERLAATPLDGDTETAGEAAGATARAGSVDRPFGPRYSFGSRYKLDVCKLFKGAKQALSSHCMRLCADSAKVSAETV
jgi:hypothetical protein